MRKTNKKGFTIVELVIVIAVIAILAAVLIPTFSGVIEKAQESAARQELVNAYKEAYALAISDGYIKANDEVTVNDFTFKFTADNSAAATVTVPGDFGYTATYNATTNAWDLD